MAQDAEGIRLYKDAYPKFRTSVGRATAVSYGSGDIVSDHSRQYYCSVLFTKLTVTSATLLKILPDLRDDYAGNDNLDFSAVAAVSRVVMDTFVSLFHFGLEQCPEEEYEARELLLFWRDVHVRKKMGLAEVSPKAAQFHDENLRQRLEENAHWQSLPMKERRHLLKKGNLLHSPDEIVKRADFDLQEWQLLHAYWSAHAHCSSVAFIRTGYNDRGLGYLNETDLGLSASCLEFCANVLNCCSDKVDQQFCGAEARAHSVEGFREHSIEQPERPWKGVRLADLYEG